MNRLLMLILALLIDGAVDTGERTAHAGAAEISVMPVAQSPTAGIQEAIDRLPVEGGIVHIAKGVYPLRQSIRIRSNVVLEGAGEETVLLKTPQVGSLLAAPAAAEDRVLRVRDAAGFRPGDALGIFDKKTVGWLHSRAVVREVRGNELMLDRRVGRAFALEDGGAVINYFSAITGVKVDGAAIRALAIDGDRDNNPGVSSVLPRGLELGFNFAAINLVDVTNSQIVDCRIDGWPSDGISLQRGSGNLVARCTVEHCRGEGYHPGGGLHDSLFRENLGQHNLANGFFFCARVQRVTVRDNRFLNNGRSGIGGLGNSGDTENLVEKNHCEANAMHGIELLSGERNTVRENTCVNNSRSTPGRWSGIFLAATTHTLVQGNRCLNTQQNKTQLHGVQELADCRDNDIRDNDCRDHRAADLQLAGKPHDGQGNATRN